MKSPAAQGPLSHRIDQFGELQMGVADKVRTDADIGVENLAGKGIGARRPHRVPLAGLYHPAHHVVAHIGRVPLGVVRLLLCHNRALKAERLECLIPHQNPLLHRVPVLRWNRVFQPEYNRLFGRRPVKLGLGFL